MNRLAACVRVSDVPGERIGLVSESLGVQFVRAMQDTGSRQRDSLRRVGDASLFVAGFFSDSLKRRLVDVDYYATLGAHAYSTLGRGGDYLAPTFAELAEKFLRFIDVLSEAVTKWIKQRGLPRSSCGSSTCYRRSVTVQD